VNSRLVKKKIIDSTIWRGGSEFRLGRDIVEFYKDKYGSEAYGAYVEQNILDGLVRYANQVSCVGMSSAATFKEDYSFFSYR
jgi:hypothetical protein